MENKKEIRISMFGQNEVTIEGLSPEEVDAFSAAVRNASYIGFKNNKLEVISKFEDLPGPIEDPVMYPFWRKPKQEEVSQTSLFDVCFFEEFCDGSCPSIYISGVCGHNYTPERYKLYVEKLESYGFECLRSKRNKDSNFWELWYLPSLPFAKGELKNYLRNYLDSKENIQLALRFLCENVDFGSLSVSVQKIFQSI